jgi:hypothetical protein
MKDRNATRAYVRAGYSSKGAQQSSARLLSNAVVAAEVNRRIEEYSRTAGIERVKILEFLRDAMFADVSKVFGPGGGILPPDQWPEDIKKLVAGYNAGTVTAAEKVTFHSRIDIAFKLLEEIKTVTEKEAVAPQKMIQVNVDKALVNLRAALAGD